MLVDVVLLRHHGAKLAREALAPAVRGDLVLERRKGAPLRDGTYGYEMAVVARLVDGAGGDVLEPIDDAYVTRVRGDSLIVIGTERPQLAGTAFVPQSYLQAWACRLAQPPL